MSEPQPKIEDTAHGRLQRVQIDLENEIRKRHLEIRDANPNAFTQAQSHFAEPIDRYLADCEAVYDAIEALD